MFEKRHPEFQREIAQNNLLYVKLYLHRHYNNIHANYCAKDVDLNSDSVRKSFAELYDCGPFFHMDIKKDILKVNKEQLIRNLTICIGEYFSITDGTSSGELYPTISFAPLSHKPGSIQEEADRARCLRMFGYEPHVVSEREFLSAFSQLPSLLNSLGIEVVMDENLENYFNEDIAEEDRMKIYA